MVIVGGTLGALVLNAGLGLRQSLHQEAQRIAQLMQLARDEAIVRNQPIAFEATSSSYRFLIRRGSGWSPLSDDPIFRERSYQRNPLSVQLDPPMAAGVLPLRVVFDREPVDKAFILTLSADNERVLVRADGVGHFQVE